MSIFPPNVIFILSCSKVMKFLNWTQLQYWN